MKDIKLFLKGCGILLAFILGTGTIYAQEGYRIEVEIGGADSNPLIMGNFFGEGTYVVDTSIFENGVHVFSGKEPLPEGMYFMARSKSRLFDFIVYKDQHFKLKTEGPDMVMNLSVAGDTDNQLFFDDMKFNAARNDEAAPYLTVLEDSSATAADRTAAQLSLSAINDSVLEHQQAIIEAHPESFMAKLFRAQMRERLPETENSDDPDAAFNYYKMHYWDHFDLSDPTFLRLNQPLYRDKLDTYFDRLVIQTPDSIIGEIDRLAQVAKQNPETYKYFVWALTLKYQNPRIMGLDEVFVHMNDTYFASGEMNYWANAQLRKNVQEYADQLRNTLIGKKAPNLVMQDANLEKRSLYDITNTYTVVYFFDPDCQHCKIATPVLDELYDSRKFDMEVFAVSTDTSMVKMKDYIKTMDLSWITVNGPRTFTEPYYKLYDAMTTPTFYILDRNKTIIAKKLPVEQIEQFIRNYEGRRKEE
jgi:peroxiredoxin